MRKNRLKKIVSVTYRLAKSTVHSYCSEPVFKVLKSVSITAFNSIPKVQSFDFESFHDYSR